MTGIDYFTLKLNRDPAAYYEGEQIDGTVIVRFDSPTKILGIKIKFRGEAIAYTTSESLCSKKKGYEKEIYELSSYYIFGNGKDEIKIPAGENKYTFSYTLPKNCDHPATLNDASNINICYEVRAKLIRSYELDTIYSLLFQYVTVVDLSSKSAYQKSIEKRMTFGRADENKLNLTVSLEKKGFSPGEKIKVSLKCINRLKVDFNVNVKLSGRVYYDKDAVERKFLKVSQISQSFNSQNVQVVELKVPEDAYILNFNGTTFVDVDYALVVKSDIPSPYKNSSVIIPIALGVESLEKLIKSESVTKFLRRRQFDGWFLLARKKE